MGKSVAELEKELNAAKAEESYVSFYSPGTFFSECSRKKCKHGDIKTALKYMKDLKERHNSSPYGFCFENGNGKSKSGMFYVTGIVDSYNDVPKTSKNEIMRSNMASNNWAYIVTNHNSWKHTAPFEKDDCVIDWEGVVIIKGNNPDFMKYRTSFKKNIKAIRGY